jgi:hypothetical protein
MAEVLLTQPQPPHPGTPASPAHDPERPPLATSPGGLAAAAFTLALSKAARSFTLYDPANEVVRQFLAAKGGPPRSRRRPVLDVLPFELLREGEVVYREEDRERSLAFKLFRDGVRRITFQQAAPWPELLDFLKLMAIRATGIRQQEEDLVTMLRKAEFQAITFAAVEGFTPEEDNPEPEERRRRGGQGARTPAGFDTPFPLLPQPGPLAYRAVGEEALAPLRAGEGAEALEHHALRLAALLLQEAGQGRVLEREAQQFLCEVRDFLIADGALAALAALATWRAPAARGAATGCCRRSVTPGCWRRWWRWCRPAPPSCRQAARLPPRCRPGRRSTCWPPRPIRPGAGCCCASPRPASRPTPTPWWPAWRRSTRRWRAG